MIGEVKFRFSLVRLCDFQACNFNILQIVSFSLIFPEIEGDNSKENGQISLGPRNAEP